MIHLVHLIYAARVKVQNVKLVKLILCTLRRDVVGEDNWFSLSFNLALDGGQWPPLPLLGIEPLFLTCASCSQISFQTKLSLNRGLE